MGMDAAARIARLVVRARRPRAEALVRAPPDGYTLLHFGSAGAINATLAARHLPHAAEDRAAESADLIKAISPLSVSRIPLAPARPDQRASRGARAIRVTNTELKGRFRSYALCSSARCRVRLASGKMPLQPGKGDMPPAIETAAPQEARS